MLIKIPNIILGLKYTHLNVGGFNEEKTIFVVRSARHVLQHNKHYNIIKVWTKSLLSSDQPCLIATQNLCIFVNTNYNNDNSNNNNNNNSNNNSNNNNNNNNFLETRKYWVDVQHGIVLSHGERDPL